MNHPDPCPCDSPACRKAARVLDAQQRAQERRRKSEYSSFRKPPHDCLTREEYYQAGGA